MGQVQRHALGIFALTLATACDSQVSPFFTGESLLTIVGSVEIARSDRDSIIPALAFGIPEAGEVRIQEVAVQGRFPSDFRIDVYEPPPADAYFNATHQLSGEPRVAAGYLTAVPPDHPDTIQSATHQISTQYSCTVETCDQPCGGKGCLVSMDEYCVDSDPSIPCYVEAMYCPTFNSSPHECTFEPIGDGDPELKESPWRSFGGFSQNYMVLFLEERARKGSVIATLLGSPSGVPAGYGLYRLREPSDSWQADRDACTAEAMVHGVSAFNEEFGTELTTLDFDVLCGPQAAGAEPGAFAAPFCGGPSDAQDEVDAAFAGLERHLERAKLELKCLIHESVVERVDHPERESVSVTIGPQLQPAFTFN